MSQSRTKPPETTDADDNDTLLENIYERAYISYTGDREYVADASVVFSSAYAPDAAVSEFVAARERGKISKLVFDLAGPLSEPEGRGTIPETIDRLLSVADLFVVGEVAARSYFGEDVESTTDALKGHAIPRAAVTRGNEGAVLPA